MRASRRQDQSVRDRVQIVERRGGDRKACHPRSSVVAASTTASVPGLTVTEGGPAGEEHGDCYGVNVKRMHLLFTLNSLVVVIVSVERFSVTARISLPPHSFLRLHEALQMGLIFLFTVIIATLFFWEISKHLRGLGGKAAPWLLVVFVVGIYYYATGNGVHELASFAFNAYCDVDHPQGDLCGGLFFNDYYTGNATFFLGAFLFGASLLLIERMNPREAFGRVDLALIAINGAVYALTVVAYAGFDRVLVGVIYTVATLAFTLAVFLSVRSRYRQFPFITYSTVAYTLGAAASLVVRLVG
jgi:hypothetical protein